MRIVGDTADLPAGWEIDHDNWGVRDFRPGDHIRIATDYVAGRGFIEDMRTYVMDAETARLMDEAA